MAITINDQPYPWAVRGQKLMIVAISDETAQPGFRYGVQIILNGTPYTFYVAAAPDDRLYFDVQSLLNDMRNNESTSYHFATTGTQDDNSEITLDFTLSEWWIVNGVLTFNEGSEVNGDDSIVINAYYNAADGYKPDPETGNALVKYSLTVSSDNMMTDRVYTTHPFWLAPSWGAGNPTSSSRVWIPSFESDYGVLCMPGNNTYLSNNNPVSLIITIYSSTGAATTQTIALNGFNIEALPVYPANLNAWVGLTVKPSLFPNWRYYSVRVVNSLPSTVSVSYNFYNAYLHGQSDCHWDKIRIGWVNSRGGWDYFNFIKKSETTDEIQRKQYKQVLFNGTSGIYSTIDRGKTDRRNLVEQVTTATSDYITEGEFQLLRSLMASNQVTLLTTRGGSPIALPINMDDTSYVEKKTRDGKLYNVTIKYRLANEYWT